MKNNKLILVLIVFVPILYSCNPKLDNSEKYIGKWNAKIDMPGGQLPFIFKIESIKKNLSATIINNEEKIDIKEISFVNDSLNLYLPAFNTRLKLIFNSDKDMLSGNLTLLKSGGVKQIMRVVATPFKEKVTENKYDINVNGKWSINFKDEDNNNTVAVGEFYQTEDKVTGTFLTTTGDYRYLNGFVNNNELQLSTFDGAHVFLFKAKLNVNGKLVGDFWSGTKWHESWIGVKNDKASLPDEDSLTYLKKGYTKLEFSFEDINGNNVSLTDEKYKGKVVLVNLAGSWCPNCHDEARFLSEYYDQNKNRGLEIIALMFENYNDKNKNIKQIKRFKEKFNIKYDLLYAGINNKGKAAELLPMLNTVLAFPTTIYIDRKGNVRKISTGFSGPGTGKYYIKFQEKFNNFLNKLLKEKQI